MRVISIGTDGKLFEEGSAVRRRVIECGKFFDELHIIVFSTRKSQTLNSRYQINSKIQISENVFVYSTNSRNKLFYLIDALKISKKIIHNSKFVIHNSVITCQDPFESGLTGALLKLFFNLPLHIQVHTDLMHKYFRQESFLNKARFFVSEFVLKYSDSVRVVSERIKKSIEQFSKNTDVLPIKISQGLTLGNGDPKVRPLEKPFSFTLLMVCRLEKEKNIETILQAIKNSEDRNIGLCVVGDGSQRLYLENMAKNIGILDRVIFAGWQNNLAPYYKMADAFVSASLYEGYGISTVEAAYFGKPLILSDTGVAGEIFKNNESAFVCDAKDENCFAQNILKIYKDKNLAQKMGRSAQMAADKHLNSENNYFKEYADSIIKTADNFKSRNFVSRIFDFKKTAFNSFMILRYFICGITAAATNIGLLYVFTDISRVWYLYSSIPSFLLALVVSFVLQKFVVFKDKGINKIRHQFYKFFVVAVLGVISNTILVFIFTDMFGVWYILSQIIAGIFVMVQNFVLYKFFIFNGE